jgi:low affinity Fe/Cu permease
MGTWFTRFSTRASNLSGHYLAFVAACLIVVLWAITGPFFGFSDTWQLVINTGTTIVTFLMVFLIQHTQNRDTRAIHLKLDELIRSIEEADNEMMVAETETDEGLDSLEERYRELSKQHAALQEKLSTLTKQTAPNGRKEAEEAQSAR